MVIQVYLDPCTVNSRKVLAGLDFIGTKFDLQKVDYFAGQHKSPEYLKVNPNATVPAAVDGDLHITESNAILMHCADVAGSDAYPKDPAKRAQVHSWLLWEASVWFPACYAYLVEFVVKPLLKTEPDQALIDEKAPRWHQLAAILDTQLGKTKYLAGEAPTIADLAVAAPMHLHAAQRLPLEQHPHLKRWLEEGVERLPCWQKTQGAVDAALLPSGASSRPARVRAAFNYTKETAQPTELYFYEDAAAAAAGTHEPGDDPHDMDVHNGWGRASEFRVDEHGFALERLPTAFNAWEDEGAVRDRFYPEVVEMLKRATGAARVLVFDHTIRTKANQAKKLTQETNTSQRAPVSLVHCDYTAESGPTRVRQLLPDEADALLGRRVAFLNVWKPVRARVEESPLAMCEIPSSPPADFFKLFLRYRDRVGENYVMRHSPAHRWWYFPYMTPDQVILLKTYDSETDGRARFVGHSAFTDPSSPPDAATRESIEIRTICFF